jgi:hypothetical protein
MYYYKCTTKCNVINYNYIPQKFQEAAELMSRVKAL